MRAILVDDEKAALDNLCFYLSKFEDIKIKGMYQDPAEALPRIVKEKPDVVFLDISMPEMSGMQAAAEILKLEEGIKIVFATAYDEYAIKAFELNAIDYLLKPFSQQRIELAVNRVKKLLSEQNKDNFIRERQVIQFEASKKELIKIPLWKNDRIFLCAPPDICYISSEEGGVNIYTISGGVYRSKDTLSYFERMLDSRRFFRCHKSFIINMMKINEVIPWFNNTYVLKMEGSEEEVPVSRNYIKGFKSLFDL
ncbi:LytTR family two component transcriptional regulator [Ruminiclostridium sufflavum DSM 19573]|uniref:Stage 0 sporulation protein A homolog n=1 Tax=Ruminiclostridium sufflavum DSM 19573 TaxID=1121337 RepID=A0A318XLJ9_9FIRM|nr:LytTR family DNA-binding domain-containing protein [Ruminiclostridium sufflavum]PYG87465.1 LytTR family two component transcriptional regulator [Ruminiclostridium sufflavum DSM 19573]